jgi:threonine dehydratase
MANDPGAETICDALLAPEPGAVTFEITRRLVSGGLAVTDAAVREAMRVAFAELKMVLEPGGAVAAAALLSGAVDGTGPVCVVLSGGNVEPALFAEIVAG